MKHVLFLLLFFLMYSCTSGSDSAYQVEEPEIESQPAITHYPEINDEELTNAVKELPRISAFMVHQQDELKLEYHSNGDQKQVFNNIKSASKGFISALVGIAIEQGAISDIDQPIETWLGDYFEQIDDERKRSITVRHLLTMSSGLESTSFRNYGRWVVSPDWVAFALNSKLKHEPGTRFEYSTGDTHLLSAVLTRATGMNLRTFAQNNLGVPAGIRIGGWDQDPKGFYFGGNNMAITPEGLLNFGRLYLKKGRLNGNLILSKDWVEKSLTIQFEEISYNERGHDYGYLWWHNIFAGQSTWFAWGYGGQFVFIFPQLDAVVVVTADPDNRTRGLNNRVYSILEEFVIPWLYHQYNS